jgi:putative YhbY family RNA-binding protein
MPQSRSSALTPATRQELKARAHALHPVVLIGDAGLTPSVLAEIDRSLTAHELIKVRVAGDDRDARLAIRDRVVAELGAQPVQTIGKLLVFWRPAPREEEDLLSRLPASRATAKKPRNVARGNPGAPRTTRGTARAGFPAEGPPRTARVRKSGQRSTKKPFQNR